MATRLFAALFVVSGLITDGGCSSVDTPPAELATDSLHIEALIDLHLANARAEVTGESAESLHNAVLAAHDLDSLALSALLEQYANHPEKAVALYERTGEQLTTERRGR